jgi:hypothetical protein
VKLPGLEVAVYPVIVDPPLSVGTVQLTTTEESPRVPVTEVGALGTIFEVEEVTCEE